MHVACAADGAGEKLGTGFVSIPCIRQVLGNVLGFVTYLSIKANRLKGERFLSMCWTWRIFIFLIASVKGRCRLAFEWSGLFFS